MEGRKKLILGHLSTRWKHSLFGSYYGPLTVTKKNEVNKEVNIAKEVSVLCLLFCFRVYFFTFVDGHLSTLLLDQLFVSGSVGQCVYIIH